MPAKKTLPFGAWPSPISAQLAAKGSLRFGILQAVGDWVYWSESRPEEAGRQAIMRAQEGGRREQVLDAPFSARSRVHEYGGGEFLVVGDVVFFVNDRDQQIYALEPGGEPRRLTSVPGMRFADLSHDPPRNRLIAVAEAHATTAGSHTMPRNLIVAITLSGKAGVVTELLSGRDFYASPRLSPDAAQVAFLGWDLPDMPWDSAALYVGRVRADGSVARPRRIAGGNRRAVFQPEWGPEGHLYFVSDESGWGRLYRWQGNRIVAVQGAPGLELSRPLWTFGARSYALHADGRVAAVFLQHGTPALQIGSTTGKRRATGNWPVGNAARIDHPVAFGDGFAAQISPTNASVAVAGLTQRGPKPLTSPGAETIDPKLISIGEIRDFRRTDRKPVFGVYYAPTSRTNRGPKGTRPPALVLAHGGPTSMTDAGLKMRVQFYTSRGFAVLDVNYAGSTGFGRVYRERLDGRWGIEDVADCEAAARYMAGAGLADADRIAIAGGSAGGYTTLMALATSTAFAAGCSHYGVSDLALLLSHTHKFESGYLHRLMGTTPKRWKTVFAERSPLNLIDGITAPVILFQGLDDKVVPPEQSRLIVEKLTSREVDVEYHEFAGEAHGFRKAETIVAVLEAELTFLKRVLRLPQS